MNWWTIEPILQKWRINKITPYFPYGGVLVDIGCDVPPVLINRVKSKMKKCIGVDIVVKPQTTGNVEIKRMDLQKKIDLPNKTADVVTLLAVLEHMKYPEDILRECYRILKPNGRVLITVPSPQNEPVLEMLSFLRLVRPEMIDQHENYFTVKSLGNLLSKTGFKKVEVSLFELGLNTFATGDKS